MNGETEEKKVSLVDILSLVKEVQQKMLRLENDMANRASMYFKETMTRKEAAAYLGVSMATINRYCRRRVITYHISEGLSYFDKEELDRFMHATKISREEDVARAARRKIMEVRERKIEPRSFLAANC